MKKFIYLSIVTFLFASCSSSEDNPTPAPTIPAVKNVAPTVPVLTIPVNNKLCVSNTVSFEWIASTDPNNDNIKYEIQVATDNQFTQNIKTEKDFKNVQTIELNKNTAYYWRIKAIDSNGLASEYSVTNKFYTTGDAVVNHLPFAPELALPLSNSLVTLTTATLKWTATDADTSDTLTYDVYLGTTNPPVEKIGDNLSNNLLNVELTSAKEYFWKVIVKDNKGGETVGQIWKFKTQ